MRTLKKTAFIDVVIGETGVCKKEGGVETRTMCEPVLIKCRLNRI